MQKIRTIRQTIEILKEKDPDTAITERSIRLAIKEDAIPHRQVGKKILINYDDVCRYFLIEGES